MIWNPGIEQADRETIRSIQLKKLKTILIHARDNVPFYRERMAKAGFIPEDVTRLEDIQKLDFTVKTDLRDHYPYGLFAVPMEDIVRIHASSGTTGKPIVAGYTREDLDVWSGVHRPVGDGRRRAQGRYCADFLWLWAVHRARWACITAWKRSARRSCPFPAATPCARCN